MNNLIALSILEDWFAVEPFVVGGVIIAIAWLFYTLALKNISPQRHKNLRERFRKYLLNYAIFAVLSGVYWTIKWQQGANPELRHFFTYWAILTIYVGSICTVRLAQITLYLYLFYSHLKVGVPRLIANSFTFVFATVLLTWVTSEIFLFNITHLLATSAIFSVVLGLALQDTLGNLLSGFALQIDRPFSIGDWVEVSTSSQNWVGQIQEINWRATLLNSFSDELISIPNKTMAQSQVVILSHEKGSARCAHTYRINFVENIAAIKARLLTTYKQQNGVCADPAPRLLVTEIADSWVVLKVFFTVKDFSLKYRIGDELLTAGLQELQSMGVRLATPKIDLRSADTIRS